MLKSKKSRTFFLILVIVASVFAGVSGLKALGLFEKFEYKFYDILLSFKKTPEERKEILLIDIDDLALDQMGNWPWTRDKIADSLLYMRELGAKTAVFDIEYLSPSQESVDFNLYQKMLNNGSASKEDIKNLFIDNDDYFARTLQFFGNSYLTVNSGNLAINYDEKELSYAKKRFLFEAEDDKNQLVKKHSSKSYSEFSPAMFSFISRAKGAGFTNVTIDSDGTRRRIPLFIKYDDGVLAQLSLAPLLKILNPEKIRIAKNHIILENCENEVLTGKEKEPAETSKRTKQTIKIPIGKDGTMLINWLKKPFAATKIITNEDGTTEEIIDDEKTSFTHCSVFYLWNLSELEKAIISGLDSLRNSIPPAKTADTTFASLTSELLKNYDEITEYKNYILSAMNGFNENGKAVGGNIEDETFSEYFSLRQTFFENLTDFANSDIFANEINSLAANNFQAKIISLATDFCNNLETYILYFAEMQKMFSGKFCIIGNTGSGTTDLGSTPFQNSYPNVGTHANVYNTIMTQDFIKPINWVWAAIVSAILALVAFGTHKKQKVIIQSIFGIALLAVIIIVPILLMYFAGIYIPLTSPILISILSYIIIMAFSFRSSEKDKKFITGAFSQCLSKDVVNEIIKDPSKLVLGGKNYKMTALFTDIEKFSGFSELLSAEELVSLLNYYLTKMSEIIIAEHGTVDKYEGDAIVAFVGAPIPMDDHACRACTAALKMKKAETLINKEIYKIAENSECPADIPETLFSAFKIMVNHNRRIFTRIGLNSGEIVAGFMGSDNKKNYTVMGNNVNLASRLEGVNKQYSTGGILISAATKNDLDERFIVRSLDRVQVVNVKTPIRLYELLEFKSEASEEFLNYVENWEIAINLFEKSDYEKSLEIFKTLSEKNPNDRVCKYYISLLENFFTKGIFPTSKDNIGVAFNPENPAEMDKSWIGTEKEIKGTFTLLQK